MKKTILLLCLFPLMAYSQNLILNGDFELGTGGWYLDSTASYQVFSIETGNPYQGSKSLRVYLEEGDTASFAQLINVSPGNKYNVGYTVKTAETGNYLFPFLQFIHGDFENVFSLFMAPEANTEYWSSRTGRILAPENSEQLILLYVFYGPGTIWLDSVYISQDIDASYTDFTLSLDEENGALKNLFQSNGIDPGGTYTPSVSGSFEELGIDYVRTHDFAIGFDHGTIVGIDSEAYDPSDPSDYYFHNTDSMAANIYASGGKIFYRFGQSYNEDPIYSSPPANLQNWADACVGILRHYNDAWNNGFEYGIDYCEIWNEPDLYEFWNGSIQEFIALYRTAATTLKAYNPDLKVGGPAFANVYDQAFVNEFLDSVTTYDLPLDFFSYHFYYLPNPYQFKITNDYVRALLDSYGLYDTEIINTEWNNGHFNPDDYWANTFSLNDPQNAAAVVSTLNYMQETDINLFFRYAFRNYWFGLCEDNGTLRYSGKAYKAFRELYENGNRLQAEGGDTTGITITATHGSGGIHVLISDNCSAAGGYNLNFNGTEAETDYNYTIYRIDESNYYEIVESSTFDSSDPEISIAVTPPFVDHIIISSVTKIIDIQKDNNKTILYPNPAKDFTTLEFGSPKENVTIKIYDPLGKLVFEEYYSKSGKIDLDLNEYDSAIYTIVIKTNKNKEIKNLVIID